MGGGGGLLGSLVEVGSFYQQCDSTRESGLCKSSHAAVPHLIGANMYTQDASLIGSIVCAARDSARQSRPQAEDRNSQL